MIKTALLTTYIINGGYTRGNLQLTILIFKCTLEIILYRDLKAHIID